MINRLSLSRTNIQKLCYSFLCFCATLNLLNAQNSLFNVGNVRMERSSFEPKALKVKTQIGKFSFHAKGGIGGLSFEEIAVPTKSMENSVINLRYDANQDDINRGIIEIGITGDSTYSLMLPDWQLIPIAHYANDTNTAVVTIIDGVRYHEAFTDNLLGWRMLQADLLMIEEDMWDLPRDPYTNEVFLADSEESFVPNSMNYDNILSGELIKSSIDNYTSYILTDWGQEISFGINDSTLFMTGEPYYLFTNVKEDNTHKARLLCNAFNSNESVDVDYFPEIKKYCSGDVFDWQYEIISQDLSNHILPSEVIRDTLNVILNKIEYNYGISIPDSLRPEYYEKELTSQYTLFRDVIQEYLIGTIPISGITEDVSFFIEKNIDKLDSANASLLKLLYSPDMTINEYIYATLLIGQTQGTEYSLMSDSLYEQFSKISPIEINDVKSLLNLDIYALAKKDEFSQKMSKALQAVDQDTSQHPKIDLLLCTSEQLSDISSYLYNYNPAIYDSVSKVMRYAALFRYVKSVNPNSWDSFYSQILKAYPNWRQPTGAPHPSPSKGPEALINQGFISPNEYRQ